MSSATGLAFTASRLLHLTTLRLCCVHRSAVPCRHMRGLREMVLLRGIGDSVLEGATRLTSLNSLQLDSTNFGLPPGNWLAGVTRLEVEDMGIDALGTLEVGGAADAGRLWAPPFRGSWQQPAEWL